MALSEVHGLGSKVLVAAFLFRQNLSFLCVVKLQGSSILVQGELKRWMHCYLFPTEGLVLNTFAEN